MFGVLLAGPIPWPCPPTIEEFEVSLVDDHAYCVVVGWPLANVIVHVKDVEGGFSEFLYILDEVRVVLFAYLWSDGAVDVEAVLCFLNHRELDWLEMRLPGDTEASEVDAGNF